MPETLTTPERIAPDSTIEQFTAEMDQLGFRTKTLEASEGDVPEGIRSLTLIDHDTQPTEPTVRLYRGIWPREDGASIAHQAPSVLKKPKPRDPEDIYFGPRPAILESEAAFEATEQFAKDPSYENMMAMVRATDMDDGDRRFVTSRIRDIQLVLLQYPDRTLLDEVRFNHIAAPAGSTSQDLSPFIATSSHAEQASGFGDTLMILDVPISRIGGVGESSSTQGDEILVTGPIEPKWITAVARFEPPSALGGLDTARKVNTARQLADTLSEGDSDVRSEEFREGVLQQKSREHHKADVKAANRDLIAELVESLNDEYGDDREAMASELMEAGISSYKEALWYVAARMYPDHEGNARSEQELRNIFDSDETDRMKLDTDGRRVPTKKLDATSIKHMSERKHWREYQQKQVSTRE